MKPGIIQNRVLSIALALCLNLISLQVFAHSSHNTNNLNSTNIVPGLGIDEKLGGFVPLDIPLIDENGKTILLKDALKGPTILTFIYYKCENTCNLLLTGIAGVLKTYSGKQENKPNLITISIDESDTPADAVKIKHLAFSAIENEYPKEKWRFLTASKESIAKVTSATGFRYIKQGKDFDHPIGLIILSPKGKIVRYINGSDFLPVDISITLLEASSGTVKPTVARVLRMCFTYDPKSHQFVFNILRVSLVVVITFVGIFICYLILSSKKRKI